MGQLTLFDLPAVLVDEIEREFFPTPEGIAEFAVSSLGPPPRLDFKVLDPGAGAGVWGTAAGKAYPGATVVGVDLPGVPAIPGYRFWYNRDFRELARLMLDRRIRFDLVVSNPPFSLFDVFAELAISLLRPGGTALFFGRIALLGGQGRAAGFWKRVPLRAVTVSSKRPSFTGDGRTDQAQEYAVFVFQQGYSGPVQLLPPFNYAERSTWQAVADTYRKGVTYALPEYCGTRTGMVGQLPRYWPGIY